MLKLNVSVSCVLTLYEKESRYIWILAVHRFQKSLKEAVFCLHTRATFTRKSQPRLAILSALSLWAMTINQAWCASGIYRVQADVHGLLLVVTLIYSRQMSV